MLANYLETPQAREDVQALLDSCDGAENSWAEKTLDSGLHWMTEDAGAWWRVGLADSQVYSVYYRPDGDRYVVTDLGEGVRALRLRTGSVSYTYEMRCIPLGLQGARIKDGCVMADHGDPYRADDCIAAADLPDALCRVMLASLKVASTPTEG
jgi:hypothetical protein